VLEKTSMNKASLFGAIGIFLLLTSLASAQSAPAWPHESSDIAPSPRVTWGKLENGLRYAILPNRTPEKLVSLRLLVLTGSLHERDDERGYAHFVEHMAFNGTRNFPAGELVKLFQRGGVAFGPHVNAVTSETHTLYKLDLPDATPAAIGDGLRALRDCADGILFEKQEVERERGVLLSEMRSRRSLDFDRAVAWRRFLFPGTLVPDRVPIGTEAAIKKATPAALRAFYDAGYRPERMVLIMAGDCAAAEVETALREQFVSLPSRGLARAALEVGTPPHGDGVRAILHNELRDGVQVELLAVRPRTDEPDTEATRLRAMRLELARSIVGRRLQRLTETRREAISGFSVQSDRFLGRFEINTLTVVGNTKHWTTLVEIAEQEVRRAAEQGFDPTELATVVDNERAALQQRAEQTPTVPSPALAETIAKFVEEGHVFATPAERLAVGLANLDATTVADCQAAWRAEWEQGDRRLFLAASPEWLKLPAKKILAAYEQSRTTSVSAGGALSEVKFAYEDFGPPGVVTQRAHMADLDVWQVRFANGVRLNLKRTVLEHGRAHFRLRFGTGRASEPREHPGLGLWAGGLVAAGLGKHTNEELRQAMRGHPMTLNMRADEDACEMDGATQVTDLRRFLQVTTAYLVDPGWRDEEEQRVRLLLGDYHGNLRLTPESVIQASIMPFLGGGEARLGLPAREAIEKHSFAVLAAWLQPMIKTAPIEATLVGEFDIDTAIAEVAATLGALAPRAEQTLADAGRELKLPRPPETRRYTYPAVAGRPTTLLLDWPVRDALTMVDRRRLRLLAAVMEDRVRVQIREERGATYAPDVSLVYSEYYMGLASLRCRLDVAGRSAKKIADQVAAIATDLAKSGVTAEEFARAQAQAIAGARQQLSRNEYWLDALDDSQSRPDRLDEVRSFERDYASATKTDLDTLAQRYLTAKNLFRFFIEPKTAR
jgi:zinc protease